MTCPSHGDWTYYSCRRFQPIILKLDMDHRATFTHVSASWVDSVHAYMFRNSGLTTLVETGCFPLGVEDLQLDSGIPAHWESCPG